MCNIETGRVDQEIENQTLVKEEKAKILSISVKIGLLVDFTWSFLAAMAKRKYGKVHHHLFWQGESIQVSERRQTFSKRLQFW